MKCYTFSHAKVTEGISTIQDAKFGTVVFLGSLAKGGKFRKVSLDKRDPAEVHNGLMKYANPNMIVVKKGEDEQDVEFSVLARPRQNKRMCLVRINTSMPEKILSGSWEPTEGDPHLISSAWGCDRPEEKKIDDYMFKWCDDLVVLKPNESVLVTIDFQSDKPESKFILVNDNGKLVCVKNPEPIEEQLEESVLVN